MYIKPTKEKLENLIYEFSFPQIAKILNVKSKTTIVRWCKYYNLPYRKEDLYHEKFVRKLHNINSDIKVVGKYKFARDNIKVRCKICDTEWEPTPDNLLHSHGCPCCNGQRFTHEYFANTINKKRNDLILLSRFKSMTDYILVKCIKCKHEWDALPSNLIYKNTQCPQCYYKSISGENSKCFADNLSILLEDNFHTYYWIGFILADGHIDNGRLSIKLGKKDYKHIQRLANYIEYYGRDITENSPSLSIMNTEFINKLALKFDINPQKTYNPSNIKFINNINLLVSLIIGFIDGDGCIRKQYKRKDSVITIKCHSSWLDNLQYISNKLYGINELTPVKAKINKQGYSNVNICHSKVLIYLKDKIEQFKLPILNRKWDRININYLKGGCHYVQ